MVLTVRGAQAKPRLRSRAAQNLGSKPRRQGRPPNFAGALIPRSQGSRTRSMPRHANSSAQCRSQSSFSSCAAVTTTPSPAAAAAAAAASAAAAGKRSSKGGPRASVRSYGLPYDPVGHSIRVQPPTTPLSSRHTQPRHPRHPSIPHTPHRTSQTPRPCSAAPREWRVASRTPRDSGRANNGGQQAHVRGKESATSCTSTSPAQAPQLCSGNTPQPFARARSRACTVLALVSSRRRRSTSQAT